MSEEKLRAAFRDQAMHCAALGSPFMERLCLLLAERLTPNTPLKRRLFDWPGDLGPRYESVPLRLCGALHALVLEGDAPLASVYPPAQPNADTLWERIEDTLIRHAAAIDRFIDSAPQTNEVRRSAALILAGHVITGHFPLPLRLSELGASAGLNLHWDRFAMEAAGQRFGPADAVLTLGPDWTGPMPPQVTPIVADRRGVDLNPLDPHQDSLRLRAYLWPDQPNRLALTEAAIATATAVVDRSDAIDWLAPRLTHVPGQTHMIYSTVAWQYFPEEKQIEGQAMIEAAGRSATDDSPLAWFQMENDGGLRGAAMTLRLWPGDVTLDLGRIDFHGRWVACT